MVKEIQGKVCCLFFWIVCHHDRIFELKNSPSDANIADQHWPNKTEIELVLNAMQNIHI